MDKEQLELLALLKTVRMRIAKRFKTPPVDLLHCLNEIQRYILLEKPYGK